MTTNTDNTAKLAAARTLGQAMSYASENMTDEAYAKAQHIAGTLAERDDKGEYTTKGMLTAAEALRALAGAHKANRHYIDTFGVSAKFDAAEIAHRIANGGDYITLAELGSLEEGGLAFGYAIKSATGRPGLSPLGKTLAKLYTPVDA